MEPPKNLTGVKSGRDLDMANWIHWIGKSYYTIHKFTEEALRIGVSRRVSLQVIETMTYGDIVSCVQMPHGYKSGAIFLEFPIHAITGLSKEAMDAIKDKFDHRIADVGGEVVDRGCGGYITGMTYIVDADMSQIAGVLKKAKADGADLGQPMIGCRPEVVQVVDKPFPLLLDIPFRQGFRQYDREVVRTLVESRRSRQPKERAKLKGQFYVENGPKDTAPQVDVQVVRDYKREG